MKIDSIKTIVNNVLLPDDMKRSMIISILAKDENVIPDILSILKQERISSKELITDLNLELSRAHCYIDEFTEDSKASKLPFNKSFIIDSEIGYI